MESYWNTSNSAYCLIPVVPGILTPVSFPRDSKTETISNINHLKENMNDGDCISFFDFAESWFIPLLSGFKMHRISVISILWAKAFARPLQ